MEVGPRLWRGRARRASGGATDGATAAEKRRPARRERRGLRAERRIVGEEGSQSNHLYTY